jgi:hypothetical protein
MQDPFVGHASGVKRAQKNPNFLSFGAEPAPSGYLLYTCPLFPSLWRRVAACGHGLTATKCLAACAAYL